MRLCLPVSLVMLLVLVSLTLAADKIVYLGDTAPLPFEDMAFATILEEMGFEVEGHADEEAQPVDTEGAVLVFVSRSTNSGNIASNYNKHSIPVIMAESHCWDDMKLATDGTFVENNIQTIIIVDEAHPIAGGLKGEVEITFNVALFMSSADWRGDVQIVANVPNGTGALACYEEGAELSDGSKAPARRVGIFASKNTLHVLTDDGRGLLERTVLWALGGLEKSVDPERALAITWGTIKANDYR